MDRVAEPGKGLAEGSVQIFDFAKQEIKEFNALAYVCEDHPGNE